jgi:hypothetical protein
MASWHEHCLGAVLSYNRKKGKMSVALTPAAAKPDAFRVTQLGSNLKGKGTPADSFTLDQMAFGAKQVDDAMGARIEGIAKTDEILQKKTEHVGWLNETTRTLTSDTSPEEKSFWEQELALEKSQIADYSAEVSSLDALTKQRDTYRAEISKYTGMLWDNMTSRLSGSSVDS